jgi:hypothetical protein
VVIWYIFPVSACLYQKKSGNPESDRGLRPTFKVLNGTDTKRIAALGIIKKYGLGAFVSVPAKEMRDLEQEQGDQIGRVFWVIAYFGHSVWKITYFFRR